MRQTKLYNNVHEDIVKSIKLKKGEKAIYRLVGIGPTPMDPTGKPAYPASRDVPSRDQVWDKEKDDWVDIAAVRSVDQDGKHKFHRIKFTKQQAATLILRGDVPSENEIHCYLALCNYNASNENRDTTKEAIFERVDEEKKAEQLSRSRNQKRIALNSVAELDAEQLKKYTAARGLDDTRKTAILRDEMEAFADADPQGFMDLLNDKHAVMKAIFNRALKKGVINFNEEQSRFEWGGTKEAILTVARSSDAIGELVAHCISSAKGDALYKTIDSKSKK